MSYVALIIDMQADFFAHERLSRRRSLLTERVNDLVDMCRRSRAPMVWVKQEFSPDLSDATLEVKRKQIHTVIRGTPGALVLPELDFRSSDHLLVKKRYSAFFGTDLDERLARFECNALIIAGINTHACVRSTVVDAYQRDYRVILAEDCIDSHDLEHHRISWKYMDGKLGEGMRNSQIRTLLSDAA